MCSCSQSCCLGSPWLLCFYTGVCACSKVVVSLGSMKCILKGRYFHLLKWLRVLMRFLSALFVYVTTNKLCQGLLVMGVASKWRSEYTGVFRLGYRDDSSSPEPQPSSDTVGTQQPPCEQSVMTVESKWQC